MQSANAASNRRISPSRPTNVRRRVAGFASPVVGVIFSLMYVGSGHGDLILLALLSSALLALAPWVQWWRQDIQLGADVILGTILLACVTGALASGGVDTPAGIWLVTLPALVVR